MATVEKTSDIAQRLTWLPPISHHRLLTFAAKDLRSLLHLQHPRLYN